MIIVTLGKQKNILLYPMQISNNIESLLRQIPREVTLVAVSKTKPEEDIQEAYDFGHRDFGENKVQEMVEKHEHFPKDIRWHMIGHVQRNKVKYMAEFVHLIHGVDSFKLLKEINKQGRKINRKIDVLLQFHIAEEDTKFGFSFDEVSEMLTSETFKAFDFVKINGVMGMATNTDDEAQVRKEFKGLKALFTELQNKYFSDQEEFKILSFGMSGDYPLAIEEGSNMIRVGSKIFGQRNYNK